MRILVDTNVLLRLAQPAHPHHPPAVRATEVLRRKGEELCLVPQVLYEYWAVCTRPQGENGLGMTTAQATNELALLKRLFTLFRDERAILPVWEMLVSAHDVKGRNTHDARLVAAMSRHNLQHLLTFNTSDFARFPGVTVFTPDSVLQVSGES
ncbi:MAG: type II toxin-antitoxin system VapC family toxin [Phycisphaerae bacterium]|nr:type II toxin-antitoxin system VapC family toxin [Phycisphaerae bacterium]